MLTQNFISAPGLQQLMKLRADFRLFTHIYTPTKNGSKIEMMGSTLDKNTGGNTS